MCILHGSCVEKLPASAKASSPPRVGSASIALCARYSLGARKQAPINASAFIRPPFAVLYKWFIGQDKPTVDWASICFWREATVRRAPTDSKATNDCAFYEGHITR